MKTMTTIFPSNLRPKISNKLLDFPLNLPLQFTTEDHALMKQLPQPSQYTVLLDQLLVAGEEGVLLKLYDHKQVEGARSGLSRAIKQYSQVRKFLSEPDETKGKYVSFTPVGSQVGLFSVKLEWKQKIQFEILSIIKREQTLGELVKDRINQTELKELTEKQSRNSVV